MIDECTYKKIAMKYGRLSSWAVWSDEGDTPTSNVGNMDVFETHDVLEILNPKFVFVGLNISRGIIKTNWGNFHDPRAGATDYKIRRALKGTSLWGAYMTDLFKDLEEKNSNKVPAYLKANKDYEKASIIEFRKEISDLGSGKPTLIALGAMVYKLLKNNFSKEFDIVKISHYAHFISKENYQLEVENLVDYLRI